MLTPEGFESLLAALDSDRARAGEKYEIIRQKLTYFFEGRRCTSALELVDETIDRVARSILRGEQVRSFGSYSVAVARNVLQEYWRDSRRRSVPLGDLAPSHEPLQPAEADDARDQVDRLRECYARCLAALPPEKRTLVLAYYQGEKREKIENRGRLAKRFRLSLRGLRTKAFRIRQALEASVIACLGEENRQ